ncbi:MAG: cupin-like domain-containing protein [Symploca sp. SIO2D2]|nr:cupin-like domain-containing protein [Symploca sp. SIO2D2]
MVNFVKSEEPQSNQQMSIERVSKLSAREFKRKYFGPGQPVIITDAIESWEARSLWSPNYFKENFGDIKVIVQIREVDKACEPSYFLEKGQEEEMTIREYLKEVESNPEVGVIRYIVEMPITDVIPITKTQIKPLDYYSEAIRRLADRKIFFWMGHTGCCTVIHYDALPNFNIQIWGRKKWVIFPKDQQDLLYTPSYLSLNYFSPINYENPDYEKYPKYKEATPIEFVLEPGETLYLPSGWAHYVRSLDFSISLNIWWVPFLYALKKAPTFYYEKFSKWIFCKN